MLKLDKKKIIQILKGDFNFGGIVATWLEDEFGKDLAYFDKNVQLIKGEEKLKKGTKEEVVEQVSKRWFIQKNDIKAVLDSLEKQGYIKFKKESKEYKVFVKIATIGGENKKLYYVNEHHLTDNIDYAKRFGLNEDKDGYAYEMVKELI